MLVPNKGRGLGWGFHLSSGFPGHGCAKIFAPEWENYFPHLVIIVEKISTVNGRRFPQSRKILFLKL